MSEAVQPVCRTPPERLDVATEVVVVGAGACGLTAGLRARDAGAEVAIVERDASPSGSTAMSSGFVPAPATRFQKAAGVGDDSPGLFAEDLRRKAKGRAVPHLVNLASSTIGPALEWLADRHGLEWAVLTDFLYPGHSRHRMHAMPEKSGAALMARLLAGASAAGLPIVTNARAVRLFADADDRVNAVEIARPDGATEIVGCRALVLACGGFGGNRDLVRRNIPEMADAPYHGHAGNTGDALAWGEALGAKLEHPSGYQGHGSLAHPHGVLISWALMVEGGFQVNGRGERFCDESGGYSEQAVKVLAQPGGVAWNIYDARLHRFALGFPDYRDALAAGAIREAPSPADLARAAGVPPVALASTIEEIEQARRAGSPDRFGRDFSGRPPFEPPFFAVRVTGALFHTQGGLTIDGQARVLRRDGRAFPNLFAGGGAACGVSGPDVSGYLSGNGLLTAIAFGYLAGDHAARIDA